jgi:hypothetical protein
VARLLLLPLLALALAPVACGGDDGDGGAGAEDRERFEALVQRADTQLRELSSGDAASPEAFAERAQAAAHELEEVAEQVEGAAPDDAREQAGVLAEELRTLSAELRRAESTEAALGDPQLVQRALESAGRVREAVAELEELGYDVRGGD